MAIPAVVETFDAVSPGPAPRRRLGVCSDPHCNACGQGRQEAVCINSHLRVSHDRGVIALKNFAFSGTWVLDITQPFDDLFHARHDEGSGIMYFCLNLGTLLAEGTDVGLPSVCPQRLHVSLLHFPSASKTDYEFVWFALRNAVRREVQDGLRAIAFRFAESDDACILHVMPGCSGSGFCSTCAKALVAAVLSTVESVAGLQGPIFYVSWH